ncbi:MAG: FlgO family outer membrane protein [Oleiphilaceae bacterium]|nr:FlgO family outer membrane protein [Oleiphilaceae bacterium]
MKPSYLLPVLLVTVLTACSSTNNSAQNNEGLCESSTGDSYPCDDLEIPQTGASDGDFSYDTGGANFRLLHEYTEQMAGNLYDDLEGAKLNGLILVASFVYFDTTLQKTSHLGNQLAEYFINDLQALGLPVSDHKLRATIQVNELGDFALSRDLDELNPNLVIEYVLTGTLVQSERGVVVNARITHHKTNKVVASTSKFLPNIVVANL